MEPSRVEDDDPTRPRVADDHACRRGQCRVHPGRATALRARVPRYAAVEVERRDPTVRVICDVHRGRRRSCASPWKSSWPAPAPPRPITCRNSPSGCEHLDVVPQRIGHVDPAAQPSRRTDHGSRNSPGPRPADPHVGDIPPAGIEALDPPVAVVRDVEAAVWSEPDVTHGPEWPAERQLCPARTLVGPSARGTRPPGRRPRSGRDPPRPPRSDQSGRRRYPQGRSRPPGTWPSRPALLPAVLTRLTDDLTRRLAAPTMVRRVAEAGAQLGDRLRRMAPCGGRGDPEHGRDLVEPSTRIGSAGGGPADGATAASRPHRRPPWRRSRSHGVLRRGRPARCRRQGADGGDGRPSRAGRRPDRPTRAARRSPHRRRSRATGARTPPGHSPRHRPGRGPARTRSG